MPPEIVGEKMEPQKLFDSVNILLSLQVRISCIQMVTFVYLKLINIPWICSVLEHSIHEVTISLILCRVKMVGYLLGSQQGLDHGWR